MYLILLLLVTFMDDKKQHYYYLSFSFIYCAILYYFFFQTLYHRLQNYVLLLLFYFFLFLFHTSICSMQERSALPIHILSTTNSTTFSEISSVLYLPLLSSFSPFIAKLFLLFLPPIESYTLVFIFLNNTVLFFFLTNLIIFISLTPSPLRQTIISFSVIF